MSNVKKVKNTLVMLNVGLVLFQAGWISNTRIVVTNNVCYSKISGLLISALGDFTSNTYQISLSDFTLMKRNGQLFA